MDKDCVEACYLYTCLNHELVARSYIWASPLAYPNLFGIKCFVVVDSTEN
jgi:hypothetical protein